jgi:hypothetical protein
MPETRKVTSVAILLAYFVLYNESFVDMSRLFLQAVVAGAFCNQNSCVVMNIFFTTASTCWNRLLVSFHIYCCSLSTSIVSL